MHDSQREVNKEDIVHKSKRRLATDRENQATLRGMNAQALATRVKMIRYPQEWLGRACGLSQDAISKIFRARRDMMLSTYQRLDRAITAEELRLRDYLIGLHGLPERKRRQ